MSRTFQQQCCRYHDLDMDTQGPEKLQLGTWEPACGVW